MKKISLLLFVGSMMLSCNQQKKYDPDKKYKIIAVHSKKCLTLSYNRPLQTISDTAGTAFKWKLQYFRDTTVQIISLPSGQSIELAEVKDQVLPYITNADSSNIRQRFKLIKNDDGTLQLESAYNSRYCIDISESDTSDYAVITTWPRENQPNQKWKIQEQGGSVVFVSLMNGKYLAVTPPTDKAGANIGQWPFANREEQIWSVQEQENGTYRFRNSHSGMYLQESDGSLSLRYNVQQHQDNTDSISFWHLDAAKDSAFQIRNVASGLCMDVRDGVPYDGANIMTYDCKNDGGGPNQLWKLEEVSEK